jgi:2-polyprenyl-3-methyl-5-hydroxy-6-metoxy-1,4-benzoquinol methylase
MGVIDYFDREAPRFAAAYERDPRFREREALWCSLIDRYGRDSCIDVGCGPGVLARYAAARGIATLGIDRSSAMIALARSVAMPNLELRVGDFRELEVAPAELVVCSSVLEYIPELDRAVARLAGLVRSGGHVLASLPNPRSLYRRAERIAFHISGKPAYRRHVAPLITLAAARSLFALHGLATIDLVYSARFAPMLPDVLAANLAVFVLEKTSANVRATVSSS